MFQYVEQILSPTSLAELCWLTTIILPAKPMHKGLISDHIRKKLHWNSSSHSQTNWFYFLHLFIEGCSEGIISNYVRFATQHGI